MSAPGSLASVLEGQIYVYCLERWIDTRDGSEILLSPVEVGSCSLIIYKVLAPSKRWLALGFLNHQQYVLNILNMNLQVTHGERSWIWCRIFPWDTWRCLGFVQGLIPEVTRTIYKLNQSNGEWYVLGSSPGAIFPGLLYTCFVWIRGSLWILTFHLHPLRGLNPKM